ncbi:hypothetical protein [Streptomyces sp. NPDC058280]
MSGEGVEFGAVDQDGLEAKVVDLWEGLGGAGESSQRRREVTVVEL